MPANQLIRKLASSALALVVVWPLAAGAAEVSLPDGARYDGPLQDGRLHGRGRLVWANGDRYEGEFRDGLMHGSGVFVGAAGARYEGEFALGYRSGEGILTWPDGTVYTGEFGDGYPSGQGRISYPDGTVYEGEFRLGREHGQGEMVLGEGSRYSGRFERGEPVEGRWDDGSGESYEGGFAYWQFAGQGTLLAYDGSRYTGTFEGGYLLSGVHEAADGARYEGEFDGSLYHGRGRLIDADGVVSEGEFRYGEYQGPSAGVLETLLDGAVGLIGGLLPSRGTTPRAEELLAEQALYLQPELLARALDQLEPERPESIDLYAVQVAGDGGAEVFRREVEFARETFERRLGASGRVVTLANSRTSVARLPMATRESIRRSLSAIAERMNPEQDILFVYLTSHGSSDHQFSIEQNGMRLPDLGAFELGQMLRELPLRYKVVVVSACYSGGFIPYLGDEHTLVITSARADRQSFGCADENELTDFGRALLEDGLGQADDFVAAFDRAASRVSRLEYERGLTPSEPQIHRAVEVEKQIKAWRRQRRR